jgi:wobble nucleotide-excising tRNase
MKIKKILKIKNVGRFQDFSSNDDDLSFFDNTLIYGHNTYGKSTLVTVLRSLNDGNKNYIIGRKTFKATDNQAVEILFGDNTQDLLSKSDWGNKNDIEIFDNEFISKNVFYGDEINKDQQSNLYNILIDEDIKESKSKIDIKKVEKSKLESEKLTLKNKYPSSKILPFDDFIKLSENTNISEEIKTKDQEIKQQENITKIKDLLNTTFIKKDFTNVKEEFNKNLDLSVEKELNDHIDKNWKDTSASRDFLSTGVSLLKKDGNCVFCGQDLVKNETKVLIESFQKIFSIEYNNLKSSIKDKGDRFLKLDIEKEILLFAECGIILEKEFNKDDFVKAKKEIDISIIKKQADLNLDIDFSSDENFIIFETELTKLKSYLTNYEKDNTKNKDSVLLNKELSVLKLQEQRFTTENKKLCADYLDIEAKIVLIKKDIDDLGLVLSKKVSQVFKENKGNINKNLSDLGANFSLDSFEPIENLAMTNPHYCEYAFVFNKNTKVLVTNKTNQKATEPEYLPHFKNTLSDSDKRLLAFAFFLSKLSNDKNLENKIIVLDDPFSSFDENRKEETIKLLKDIKNKDNKKPAQKIILTHDHGFLAMLYKRFAKDDEVIKVIKIHYSPASGSKLELCDIEQDFLKEDFFKDLEYIKDSIEHNKNINEALKKVRPCMEHLLKRKYYFCLDNNDLKIASIDTYLQEAKIGNKCLIKSEILSDNWHEDMHDNHPIMKLNEPAKLAKLKRSLEIFEQI